VQNGIRSRQCCSAPCSSWNGIGHLLAHPSVAVISGFRAAGPIIRMPPCERRRRRHAIRSLPPVLRKPCLRRYRSSRAQLKLQHTCLPAECKRLLSKAVQAGARAGWGPHEGRAHDGCPVRAQHAVGGQHLQPRSLLPQVRLPERSSDNLRLQQTRGPLQLLALGTNTLVGEPVLCARQQRYLP
jgi:hypothetical protein